MKNNNDYKIDFIDKSYIETIEKKLNDYKIQILKKNKQSNILRGTLKNVNQTTGNQRYPNVKINFYSTFKTNIKNFIDHFNKTGEIDLAPLISINQEEIANYLRYIYNIFTDLEKKYIAQEHLVKINEIIVSNFSEIVNELSENSLYPKTEKEIQKLKKEKEDFINYFIQYINNNVKHIYTKQKDKYLNTDILLEAYHVVLSKIRESKRNNSKKSLKKNEEYKRLLKTRNSLMSKLRYIYYLSNESEKEFDNDELNPKIHLKEKYKEILEIITYINDYKYLYNNDININQTIFKLDQKVSTLYDELMVFGCKTEAHQLNEYYEQIKVLLNALSKNRNDLLKSMIRPIPTPSVTHNKPSTPEQRKNETRYMFSTPNPPEQIKKIMQLSESLNKMVNKLDELSDTERFINSNEVNTTKKITTEQRLIKSNIKPNKVRTSAHNRIKAATSKNNLLSATIKEILTDIKKSYNGLIPDDMANEFESLINKTLITAKDINIIYVDVCEKVKSSLNEFIKRMQEQLDSGEEFLSALNKIDMSDINGFTREDIKILYVYFRKNENLYPGEILKQINNEIEKIYPGINDEIDIKKLPKKIKRTALLAYYAQYNHSMDWYTILRIYLLNLECERTPEFNNNTISNNQKPYIMKEAIIDAINNIDYQKNESTGVH